jgi:hypothetical protein
MSLNTFLVQVWRILSESGKALFSVRIESIHTEHKGIVVFPGLIGGVVYGFFQGDEIVLRNIRLSVQTIYPGMLYFLFDALLPQSLTAS